MDELGKDLKETLARMDKVQQLTGFGWNFSIMAYEDGTYGIHEVFSNDTGDKWVSWTEDAVPLVFDSLEDLKTDWKWMSECLDKPILDYETGKEIKSGIRASRR